MHWLLMVWCKGVGEIGAGEEKEEGRKKKGRGKGGGGNALARATNLYNM